MKRKRRGHQQLFQFLESHRLLTSPHLRLMRRTGIAWVGETETDLAYEHQLEAMCKILPGWTRGGVSPELLHQNCLYSPHSGGLRPLVTTYAYSLSCSWEQDRRMAHLHPQGGNLPPPDQEWRRRLPHRNSCCWSPPIPPLNCGDHRHDPSHWAVLSLCYSRTQTFDCLLSHGHQVLLHQR